MPPRFQERQLLLLELLHKPLPSLRTPSLLLTPSQLKSQRLTKKRICFERIGRPTERSDDGRTGRRTKNSKQANDAPRSQGTGWTGQGGTSQEWARPEGREGTGRDAASQTKWTERGKKRQDRMRGDGQPSRRTENTTNR